MSATALDVLLLLIGQAVNRVVDGEDVLGVETLLHAGHKVYRGFRQDLLHKSLSDLADAVMMGETAADLEDLVSALVLDLLVDVHDLVARDVRVGVVVTEVNVDGSAGLVDLGHAEGDKETVLFNATVSAGFDKTFTDFQAKG